MGPKTFITCYVCLKEFGSKSITFHEPQCLERWRSSNKSLPNDKRTPTPVKPTPFCNNTQDWVCSNCWKSVPAKRKREHISVCSSNDSSIVKNLKSIDNNKNDSNDHNSMTGVVKTEFSSPKKGKENKNNSNHIPVPSVGRKNAKNDAKPETSDIGDKSPQKQSHYEVEEITSTSNRSVRPQTKILRRPTPNLKHPVIQMDSDDSSGDSSCSDKSKEDNPKRLKMGNESSSSDSASHKPKNFIIYNKYNVEKNTIKNSPKERASATAVPTIPNPCNSCNRSLAPERLHSHAKKDSRGLMYRKSPSLDLKVMSPQQKLVITPEKSPTLDVKMASPQQKVPDISNKSQNVDVKMTSPQQKIPEIANKSPNMDIKMTSPRKKVSDLSEKSDVKMTSPQQKLSKLTIKPPSLELKPTYHPKTSDASYKPLSSDGKTVPKLNKLDKSPAADAKPQQKTTEASDKQQHSDVKMVSPKKKISRSPPYKILNKINKPVHSEQYAKDGENSKDTSDSDGNRLSVPDSVATAKDEEMEKSCYICLKDFKASCLQMHESKCLETWKKENNSLTPNLRKLPPRRPPLEDSNEDEEIEADEDDPTWSSVQSQLVPCELCGRTFFPERLPVHRRVCKGKSSPRPLKRAASLREQSASSTDGEDRQPAVYVPCYVCGRNYGSWVITMHEQKCLKKWRRENDKLPDDEQQEEPKRIPHLSPDDDVTSLAELGDNAWESHLQQLVPCPLCARTFFPDRLGVHKRSCKGPPTTSSRRPRSNKGA